MCRMYTSTFLSPTSPLDHAPRPERDVPLAPRVRRLENAVANPYVSGLRTILWLPLRCGPLRHRRRTWVLRLCYFARCSGCGLETMERNWNRAKERRKKELPKEYDDMVADTRLGQLQKRRTKTNAANGKLSRIEMRDRRAN